MLNGYMGKLLQVDLSRQTLADEPLDEAMARRFIGGYGLAARLIFDRQPAGADPFGPDNIIGFFTGPFTGTPAVSGTRFTVAGKSPLTGTWGDANSGGTLGAFLKFSGYDAVLFKGIAAGPVYLFIDNGKAELRDAAHIWGKDTYDTEDILRSELGDDIAVACIGPAGEKLSLIAAIIHGKGSAAARSGLAAVLGAKKVKALAVRGSLKVPLADEKTVRELRKMCLSQLGGHVDVMRKLGTTFTTVPSIESGDSPVKNWGGLAVRDFPDATPLDGEVVAERKLKRVACYQCPIGCEAILKAGKGEYRYAAGSFRPEYETIVMLGSNCLIDNIESIIKANDICNRQGVDTISAGAVMAFVMECYEKGLITKKDTGGIEMTWGNHRAMVAMLEKLARREGFGDVIADGVRVAAQKIGPAADAYAIHVHGQEVPGHNPIASFAMGTTYLTNATPARHTQGSEEHHQEGFIPSFDKSSCRGRGKAHAKGAKFQHALMCTGMCLFVNMAIPKAENIADFVRAVTGWAVTTEELIETGERIENMRWAFNIREGVNQRHFTISDRLLGRPPHQEGPLAGVAVDAEALVNEYLAEMHWDFSRGGPSGRRLRELGLEDVADALGL